MIGIPARDGVENPWLAEGTFYDLFLVENAEVFRAFDCERM